jgi:exodeoxyribonuclease VII large subunit
MDKALSVSEIVGACSSALELSFERVVVEGEVASYKVNQGKFVFFDLKDAGATLPCFMMLFAVKMPVVDGMRVRVVGTPKVTAWGKFSFTVAQMMPVGEGDIKKSFEMLKQKLAGEGLFDVARKRALPAGLTRIGVVSSTQAAGYADFVKILDERWGGLEVEVIHTQVQGLGAAEQIGRALERFNELGRVEVIAVVRGGGSADDLAVFNDEGLARAIAASKIPVITGIGHEVDESLADLVADVRASTPSNAAQMLTPRDKRAEAVRVREMVRLVGEEILERIAAMEGVVKNTMAYAGEISRTKIDEAARAVVQTKNLLEQLNPERVLARGYAILKGDLAAGSVVKITTKNEEIEATINKVRRRNDR